MEVKYYSQCGQDKYLDQKIFKEKKNGFFLDIGAHDGVSFSNTYFFERYRGWKGICIEPNPKVYESLQKNRTSINVQACIAEFNGKSTFLQLEGRTEMLSGLVDKYEEKHLQRIEREIKNYGGKRQEIEVECISLDELVKKHNIQHIDYCNIDVEGNELKILKSIDFDAVSIDIFTVENNYKSRDFNLFMKSKGYSRIKVLEGDEVYSKLEKKPFWKFW